jgi:putative spermidine/putrescine transport system permease protein
MTDTANARGARKPIRIESDFKAIPTKTLVVILLPTIAIIALFLAGYGSFILMSFREMIPGTSSMVEGKWTLGNYARFFRDFVYPYFLFETIYRSLQVTVLGLLIAYPLAYCIARTSSKVVRQIIMMTMVIPMLVGGITIVYSWLVLLGNVGLVNTGLKALGILGKPIRFLYGWSGVIICLVYFLIPYAAFSLVGPIRNVPRSLEEAAVTLVASKLTVFFRIVLPLTLPGIVEAASLTLSLALSSFLFPMMLGGGKVKMMSNIIYETIFVTYDFPFAGTLATILLVVSIAVVALMTMLQRMVRRTSNE